MTEFRLPSGLLRAAQGMEADQGFRLPSGLMRAQGGQTAQFPTWEQFTQNAIAGFVDNAGGLDLSGLSWNNPNDNPIEQFLNEDQPGQPYFKVRARIEFDPETGRLVSVPIAERYDELYHMEPTGDPYYTGYKGGKELGQFSIEDVQGLPGYTEGQTFRPPGEKSVYYYHGNQEWVPEADAQEGYIYPQKYGDNKYVNNYVQGTMPYDIDGVPADTMTDIVAQAFNPTITGFLDYLNANLNPEQMAAAFDNGADPLNLRYKIHDWDLVKKLITGGGEPVRMLDDMTDWAGGLYDAAGLDFEPNTTGFRLPSGLL